MDTRMWEEMQNRIEAAQADAELCVGWVHDVMPHAEYGMPGVAVPVTWMESDGQVTGRVLWVPIPGVLELLTVLNKLHSEAFTREMEKLEEQLRPTDSESPLI